MLKLFNKVLIIGVGLIGSSIARALKDYELTDKIVGCDINTKVKDKCKELKITEQFIDSIEDLNDHFDLIIICSPLGTYKNIFKSLNRQVKQKCLVTDVGSTKLSGINDFKSSCNNNFQIFRYSSAYIRHLLFI